MHGVDRAVAHQHTVSVGEQGRPEVDAGGHATASSFMPSDAVPVPARSTGSGSSAGARRRRRL